MVVVRTEGMAVYSNRKSEILFFPNLPTFSHDMYMYPPPQEQVGEYTAICRTMVMMGVSSNGVTHLDYIHDEETAMEKPRFIRSLQKTIEVRSVRCYNNIRSTESVESGHGEDAWFF